MHGDFDFSVLSASLPFLWTGLQFTLKLTIVAMLGGIALGTLLALARLSPVAPLAKAAAAHYTRAVTCLSTMKRA